MQQYDAVVTDGVVVLERQVQFCLYELGDVNGDGSINITDAYLI